MEEDLRNYKLQLQQVEAALTTDPSNEELIKLKGDLQEVIELTQDLLKNQESATNVKRFDGEDDVTASLLVAEQEIGAHNKILKRKKWKIGDRCYAKWEEDKQYYGAVIEDIVDVTARVLFSEYNQLETCHLDDLKEVPSGVKRSADDSGDDAFKHGKPHNRDYLKKKNRRNNSDTNKLKKNERPKRTNGCHSVPNRQKRLVSKEKVYLLHRKRERPGWYRYVWYIWKTNDRVQSRRNVEKGCVVWTLEFDDGALRFPTPQVN